LQGKGAGKMLLNTVIKNIQQKNAEILILTVNRNNTNAKFFTRKQGFTVLREEKIDIGGGYFMDDYIMGKELNSCQGRKIYQNRLKKGSHFHMK
jgi:ribosomal protein S18 acetylase RimI-like enzyme